MLGRLKLKPVIKTSNVTYVNFHTGDKRSVETKTFFLGKKVIESQETILEDFQNKLEWDAEQELARLIKEEGIDVINRKRALLVRMILSDSFE